MWICSDNQDVGLEAAIIERVRNSSLVKWIRAENSTGLKLGTEATDPPAACRRWMGFSPIFRYSYRHSHFQALHQSLRSSFNALGTLSYH